MVRLDGPCWVAWRAEGTLLSGAWYSEGTLAQVLTRAGQGPQVDKATMVELCLTSHYRAVPSDQFSQVFSNVARGHTGIEIALDGRVHRVAPSQTIATNRSFVRECEIIAERLKMAPAVLRARADIRAFAGRVFLIRLTTGAPEPAVELYRSNQLIPPEAVNRDLLDRTVQGLSQWMVNNLKRSGRMCYKYWPSRGTQSRTNNTIRQFMATIALGRLAARDAELRGRVVGNLRYNLQQFYQQMDDVGTIVLDGKAKLGAMAVAALAIAEFRNAGLVGPDDLAEEFDGLSRGVLHLWQDNGAFRTFLAPAGRNDNQNFYPGEALVFWAEQYRMSRDADLLERFRTSFAWYSEWHRANPNPAFVPWHVQACARMYRETGISTLSEFVFERTDWLLQMQQWGGDLQPDLWGRFYNPARPDFGPPHASATGVYMEGLAEAWALATDLEDDARADRYGLVLRRGLRSIAQLQFCDPDVDGFYISRKQRVMGALRTETYSNEIRVDNVQHCLMALMALQDDPRFEI